jgi:hypothetical protein
MNSEEKLFDILKREPFEKVERLLYKAVRDRSINPLYENLWFPELQSIYGVQLNKRFTPICIENGWSTEDFSREHNRRYGYER